MRNSAHDFIQNYRPLSGIDTASQSIWRAIAVQLNCVFFEVCVLSRFIHFIAAVSRIEIFTSVDIIQCIIII